MPLWHGGFHFNKDDDFDEEDDTMTTMTTTMMMTMTMTTTSFFDAITNLVVGRIPDRGGGGILMAKLKTMMLTTKTVMTTTMIMTMRTWLDALLEGGNRFDNDSLEEGGGKKGGEGGIIIFTQQPKDAMATPPCNLHQYVANVASQIPCHSCNLGVFGTGVEPFSKNYVFTSSISM
jgi:hypothetical protein